ncbi:MAG TPA: hypothetical protein VE088_06020 [Gaiellaceae bacterium]|nr:hypothetical protein [Gaiellaceae bacterium]
MGVRRAIATVGVAATFAAAAAGCGGGRTTQAASTRACVLSGRQRQAIALAERDIRRLHGLEARVRTYSYAGTPAMQQQTNRVLLDVGRVPLPINTRARLLRLGKGASALCGSCFGAFEAAEPSVVSRFGGAECGG